MDDELLEGIAASIVDVAQAATAPLKVEIAELRVRIAVLEAQLAERSTSAQ